MQTIVPSSQHASQNGSQWSEWKLGRRELRRVLREGDRVAALRGDAAHLVGHRLRVPDRRQRERDEPARDRCRTTRRCASRCTPAGSRARRPCRSSGRRAARRGSGTTGSTSSRARRWRSCRGRARGCRSSRRGSRRTTSARSRTPRAGGRRPRSARCWGSPCPRTPRRRCRRPCARRRGATSTYLLGSRPSNMSGGSTTWSSTLTRIRSSSRTRLAPPCRRSSAPCLSAPDVGVRIPGTMTKRVG